MWKFSLLEIEFRVPDIPWWVPFVSFGGGILLYLLLSLFIEPV